MRLHKMKAELVALILGVLAGAPSQVQAAWQLVWNDEFNGTAVDTTRWTYDIGTGPPYPGWGNNELQYYTSRPQNAYLTNGLLHIVARKESYAGASYTSARLKTQERFSQTYGRFTFRARLPRGQGYWPAFWLMPRDSVYGGWAASGEIDAMEIRGQEPGTVFGTIHFGGEWPNNAQSFGPAFVFPIGDAATDIHCYTLEWNTNSIRWHVDNTLYQEQTTWWSSGGPFPAPFDQPFYIVMNLAVGGYFPGSPDSSTIFPGEIQVDYVRVYSYTPTPVAPVMFTSIRAAGDRLIITGTNGPPRATFYLLSSRDASQPLSRWVRLATNQFDSAGGFTQNLNSTSPPAFYQVEVP